MPKIPVSPIKLNKEDLIRLHTSLSVLTKNETELEQLAQCAVINAELLHGDWQSLFSKTFYRNNKYTFTLLSIFDYDWLNRAFEPKEAADLILLAAAFVRANDVYNTLDDEEKKFVVIIDQIESLLQTSFTDFFVPFLTEKENLVLKKIQSILSETTDEELKIQMLTDYLATIQDIWLNDLYLKKEELLDYILNIYNDRRTDFGWQTIPPAVISKEKKRADFGYNSNISAFFFNDLRRLKEQAVSDLLSTRAITWSFNRNIYKLSVLSHLRGFFRALVFQGTKNLTQKYKLFVPSFVLPTLKSNSTTKKFLLKTLTFKEWFKISELDGLGLHHNSQEYYYPVI